MTLLWTALKKWNQSNKHASHTYCFIGAFLSNNGVDVTFYCTKEL